MNHKDFCTWLEGYMEGVEYSEKVRVFDEIRNKLKDVGEPVNGTLQYPPGVRDSYEERLPRGE